MSDERFERDLGDVVRTLSGEDASPELHARLAAVADQPASRRTTWFSIGWRIAATVAAAVALVALVSLLAPRMLGPEPASTPSAPPAEGAWTGLRWSAPVAPPDGTQIRDILAWGGEWVGVGVYQQSDTQTGAAAFLTSPDGTHWRVDYHYNALEIPTHLVPLGNGLLAVSDQAIMLGGCCSTPLLWQSDDGSTWYGIQPQGDWNTAWLPDVHPVGVAGGPNGVVVIASGPDSAPIILHSVDGRTWTRVRLPASFDHAILLDVAAFRGGFVVVGRDGQPDVPSNTGPTTLGLGRPAAWISSDGVTWTAAQVEGSALVGGELSAVVAGADGLFATGVDGPLPSDDAITGTWVSADGASWRRTTSGGTLPMIAGLAGDGQRMIRLAPQFAGSDGSGMAGWVSTDGVTWSRLAFSGSVSSLPLAATTAGGDPLGQVWVGPSGVIVNGQRTGALRFGAATGTAATTPTPALTSPEPSSLAATAPACLTSQLSVSVVDSGAGLGTVAGWIRFVNASAQPCSLRGYPSVVGVTAEGAQTTAGHATGPWGFAPIDGTPAVTLLPGESALAQYIASDAPTGSADTCPPPYASLRVTPPGGTGFASISAWNAWLGSLVPSCNGIEVTAVVAASAEPDVDLAAP